MNMRAACKLLALSAFALISVAGCARRAGTASDADGVSGSYIAALCDTEAAVQGHGEAHALTVLRLPINRDGTGQSTWQTSFAQLPINSSATNRPGVIAATSAGNAAFIVTADASHTGAGSAGGSGISGIDLSDPMSPKIAGAFADNLAPLSVAVSPSGSMLAIGGAKADMELGFATIDGAVLRSLQAVPLGQLGLPAGSTGWHVAWHPSGKFIAVVTPQNKSVAFFDISVEANGDVTVSPHGAPVICSGGRPMFGAFCADGSHFAVACAGEAGNGGMKGAGALGGVCFIKFQTSASDGVEIAHSMSGMSGVVGTPTGLTYMTADGDERIAVVSSGGGSQGGQLAVFGMDGMGSPMPVALTSIEGSPTGVTVSAAGTLVVSRIVPASKGGVGSEGELRFFTYFAGGEGIVPKLSDWGLGVGVGQGPHGAIILR